ncbi:MAG TPA: TlpA disulfide reductase family protein [Gemmatimonadales bacterium]|nr:TlpA disulfide reductase family protein [Gemmatimonadales bacterium]
MHALPRSLRAALSVALIALSAAAAGCSRGTAERASSQASPDTLALEPATAEQVLARVREPGARATLVNVWATWCGPCREEFPAIVSLAERRRADGLRVLFVSADFDDQAAEARAFLASHRAPGPWLLKSGPDMEFIDGLDRRWTGALPATIVYDSNGAPVEFWEGGADSARFETAVAPLLDRSR